MGEKRIPTNLRTLLILEVLGRNDKPMSPTEMNAAIGLPKQTIHRLVSTLVEEGFLIRDADRNKFRPSRRLRKMGAGLLFASRSNIMRHQILEETAKALGEAVNFVVPEEAGMKYLDRVETNWPFRVQLPRGSNVPFHATASGKCFMASLPKKQREKFIGSLKLEALTPNTIVEPDALMDELATVRKNGFSQDKEELIENMTAFAVPIYDDENRFMAALACHGPKERFDAMEVS